jgi:hypothetical protein
MTMTNEQTSTLVFKSEAGDYFLVPRATLEQCRVPEAQKVEIEQLLAAGPGDPESDVQGYIAPLVAVGIFLVGEAIGFGATYAATTEFGTLKGRLH